MLILPRGEIFQPGEMCTTRRIWLDIGAKYLGFAPGWVSPRVHVKVPYVNQYISIYIFYKLLTSSKANNTSIRPPFVTFLFKTAVKIEIWHTCTLMQFFLVTSIIFSWSHKVSSQSQLEHICSFFLVRRVKLFLVWEGGDSALPLEFLTAENCLTWLWGIIFWDARNNY